MAGDLSGLSATGRPISSHGRKQISQLVRSILNQPGHKHTHKSMQDLEPYSSDHARPHTMLTERSKSFAETSSSSSSSRPTASGENAPDASGHFVANFCQTVLSSTVLGGSSSAMLRGGSGLKSSTKTEEGETSGADTSRNGYIITAVLCKIAKISLC